MADALNLGLDIKASKLVYAAAFATLLTGSGVTGIFDKVPMTIRNLFSSKLMKFVVLVLLVWQSDQPLGIAIVTATAFWVIAESLNYAEDNNLITPPKFPF